jgi:hypothetical protein
LNNHKLLLIEKRINAVGIDRKVVLPPLVKPLRPLLVENQSNKQKYHAKPIGSYVGYFAKPRQEKTKAS